MGVQPKPPTIKGPAEWFTGDVWIDPIVRPEGDSTLNIGAVHFTPGARTAWHAHEGGQTLYVTEGRGLVQSRGEKVVEIRPGDVHVTADGQQHWHRRDTRPFHDPRLDHPRSRDMGGARHRRRIRRPDGLRGASRRTGRAR